VVLAPSVDDLERVYRQAKRGAFSNPPFEEVVFQSVLDPSVAPPRKHTMTCSVRFAPRRLAGTTWEEFAPQAAEIALDTLERYAPDVRRALRSFQVVTPETIERTLGMTGGSCYHGNITPDQMFGFRPLPGWARYRTPVPGLYLCGAATHPGGGVMGAAGHNAARAMLEDWGMDPDRVPLPPAPAGPAASAAD
jgi:phytoene dehydrogenase-like protein